MAVPPRISIVMPVYNRLEYLREAVACVCVQSHADWELLIADDGSDAPTQRYLQDIAQPARISVLGLTHTGRPAVARNAALARATGEFVAFLDSDDLWSARKLETQLAAHLAHPASRWSYSAFRNVDSQGVPLASESTRRFVPASGRIFERMLAGEVSIRTPTVMVRRDLLQSAGGFDERLASAEDYDLWLRLALLSPLHFIGETLVDVRHHDVHHSAAWREAYRGQEQTFRKLAHTVPPHLRAAVARARVRNAVRCAADHGARGDLSGGFGALARGAPFCWTSALYWRQLARLLARLVLPRGVLAQLTLLKHPS